MQILIVTPAKRGSQAGNRITADRWARILSGMGHQTQVAGSFVGESVDLLIALHARRSYVSIKRFHNAFPNRRIILAMTGTDLNVDLGNNAAVDHSIQLANRIVLLEPLGSSKLSKFARLKSRVIVQSAVALEKPPAKLSRWFEVSVLAHLRPIKDPFRAALAARQLPSTSKVKVVHFGRALTKAMERRAIRESNENDRYRWFGSVSHREAQRRLARSRLTVLSSKSEGGPALFSEAIVNGIPILASRIEASIGILGADYPGLFDFRDTSGLADLVCRSETDPGFFQQLKNDLLRLKPAFLEKTEIEKWKSLIQEI